MKTTWPSLAFAAALAAAAALCQCQKKAATGLRPIDLRAVAVAAPLLARCDTFQRAGDHAQTRLWAD